MKTRAILAVTILSFQAAHATTYIYTDMWDMDRATTLTGSRTTQTLSDTATDTDLALPYFNGSDTLTRVRIIYTAPLAGISDITSATMSVSTDTSHLSSASLKAQTGIGSDTLFNDLLGINSAAALAFRPDGYTKTATDSKGAFDLTNPNTVSFSAARDFNTTVLDTTNPAILAYFSQSGNFGFQLDSTVTGSFSRLAADPGAVTFNIAGVDSGTLEVIYDTTSPALVPEPSTVFAAGFLGLLSVSGFVRGKIKRLRS